MSQPPIHDSDRKAAEEIAGWFVCNAANRDGDKIALAKLAQTAEIIARHHAEERAAVEKSAWQPIETVPKNERLFFWIVPKSAKEAYVNSSGNPITMEFEPYMLWCNWCGWSAISKPTHWMRPPSSPSTEDDLRLRSFSLRTASQSPIEGKT